MTKSTIPLFIQKRLWLTFFSCIIAMHIAFGQCGSGPCEVCQVDATITSISGGTIVNGFSNINGDIQAGQNGVANNPLIINSTGCGEISISVELDFTWDRGDANNWIHGISFFSTPSWVAAQGVIIPPNPGWIFQNSITGVCSSNTYGAGYYWDPVGTNCGVQGNLSNWNGVFCAGVINNCEQGSAILVDGDPSDNWGINCDTNCPKFGFDLVYCPPNSGNAEENIEFYLTEDGETGGWYNSDGCVFLLTFPVEINSAGTTLPDEETICYGDCVTLEPGSGCDMYEWSTGETTQTIEVCPTVDTEYYLTVSGASGCMIMDTIEVIVEYCCDAEAGSIPVSSLCPDETFDAIISGYYDDPDYEQYIIITDASGVIIDIVLGDTYSVYSDICTEFQIASFNNNNLIGFTPIPIIGDNINNIDCVNNCCDLEIETLIFEDTSPPIFSPTPPDATLDCITDLMPLDSLAFTDDCMEPGKVWGTETGVLDFCTGGSITREWMVTDLCGNSTNYIQSIQLDPYESPMFLNLPPDITVSCDMGDSPGGELNYDNFGSGICSESGAVPGVVSGMHDQCGGSYSVDWMYTDTCGNTISHTQNITVDSANEAMVLSPPSDMTVSCSAAPTSFLDLDYDNNIMGPCNISGTLSPSFSSDFDGCGGSIEVTWEGSDPCGRLITYTQNITIDPAPEPEFLNTPADLTVDCDAIPPPAGDLEYANSETGTCLITGFVSPTITDMSDVCGGNIQNEWSLTDLCGRTINYVQTITINPVLEPEFENPPIDLTVDCSNLPSSTVPSLNYNNGLAGGCNISGVITGTQNTFDPCIGEILREWSDVDECGNILDYMQTITVDNIPPVIFSNPPSDITVTCDNIPNNPAPLNYSNNATGACLIEGSVNGVQNGTYNACGGIINFVWNGVTPCGDQINHIQNIEVLPASPPTFANPPADITVNCVNVPPNSTLSYSNGASGVCQIEGNVNSFISGSYDYCGGVISKNWQFTDDCGTTISAIQNITVNPAPAPSFTNPPPNVTVNCEDYNSTVTSLNYSNGLSGNCAINGTVGAIVTGAYDFCGGVMNQFWTFTDECGRVISHQRVVTVNPASTPFFTNPPADLSLSCNEIYAAPPDLTYTNGSTGLCALVGTVSPTIVQNGDIYTHTWEFIDPCSNTLISHVQTVTLSPALDIVANPLLVTICEGENFDLNTIEVLDQNGADITLTFYEGASSATGILLDNLIVSPLITTVYTIFIESEFGCVEEIIFTIVVDQKVSAGEGIELIICENEAVNLFDGLSGTYDINGNWIDISGSGVNLDNPMNVSFNGVQPGEYVYQYAVPSTNTCPPDETEVTVILTENPNFTIDSVNCTPGGDFYTVYFNAGDYIIAPQAGELVELMDDYVQIINIPIDQSLLITAFDALTGCVFYITVNPPDCDCPTVLAPIKIQDYEVCFGETNPILQVQPITGTTVNWYDAASGGNLLIANSTTYTPSNTAIGVYTFYAESESIEFPGCVSNQRTPVKLEILALPQSANVSLSFCSPEDCLEPLYNISNYISDLSPNANNVVVFYSSEMDRENELNPTDLSSIITCEDLILYATITNAKSCQSYAQIEVAIEDDPIIELIIENEICLDDNNGEVTIELIPASPNYQSILNGIDYGSDLIISDLSPDSYILEVINQDNDCSSEVDFEIFPGIELEILGLSFNCDNNGTDTDPDDDIINISFTVTNSIDISGQCIVFLNGVDQGSYNYDELLLFTVDADGSSIEITIQDIDQSCEITTQVGPLNPCSTNCSLSLGDFQQQCFDNGTPSDPSDDYYEFTLLVSAINGSIAGTYNVWINGVPVHTFDYGTISSFQLQANGMTPTIQLIDSEDNQCSLNLSINPLASCSDECAISIAEYNIVCDNNGTEDVIADDFYTVDLVLTYTNQSSSNTFNVLVDSELIDEFTYPNASFVLPASGSNVSVEVIDTENLECNDIVQIGPLNPCSSSCFINIVFDNVVCNDNGTSFDPSDDYYEFEFLLQSIEGSADSTYQIYINGTFYDFGMYSINWLYSTPANDEIIEFQFIDNSQEFCTAYYQYDLLTPCSDSCLIIAEIEEIYCDNAGTNNVEDDDVFYVVLNISGQNVSTSWHINALGETGLYNTLDTLGPFLIDQGGFLIEISDNENLNCPVELFLDAPAFCSSCEQTMNAGPNKLIDCQTPSVLLEGESSEIGVYQWTSSNGFSSDMLNPTATKAGIYYLEILYEDGCSQIDSMEVEVLGEIPIALAGEDAFLTCMQDSAILQGSYESNFNVNYAWYDENDNLISSTATVVVYIPGTYYLVITDIENNCQSAPDFVQVFDDTDEPSVVIYADPGNIIDCIIGSINLTTDNEVNVIYNWSNEEFNYTGNAVEVFNSGFINLLALDTISGCFAVDSIEILDLTEFPNIVIEDTEFIDCNNSDVILDISNSFPNTNVEINWFDSENNLIDNNKLIISVSEAGFYFVEVIDPNTGCQDLDTIEVLSNLTAPEILSTQDGALGCGDSETMLEVQTGVGVFDFSWSTVNGMIQGGVDQSMITANATGQYEVIVTNLFNGCDTTIILNVIESINPPNLVQFDVQNESCYQVDDGSLLIEDIIGGTEPYTIYVNDDLVDVNELQLLTPGFYDILIVDAASCTLDTSIIIQAAEALEIDGPSSIDLQLGESQQIFVETNIVNENIDQIIWAPAEGLSCTDCLNPTIIGGDILSYTVTIIDENGCSISMTIVLRVFDKIKYYVPTVFSPNADGVNEGFTIYSDDIVEINYLKIFNRWGELVFEKENFQANIPSEGWAGSFKGRPVNPGVFVYVASVTFNDQSMKIIDGDITVIK